MIIIFLKPENNHHQNIYKLIAQPYRIEVLKLVASRQSS